MSFSRQTTLRPDDATAALVGATTQWPPRSEKELHSHSRHQLMYSVKGVIHVSTAHGGWILPPSKALWISGGTPHALVVKRPVELIALWAAPQAPGVPDWDGCKVVNVSALVRELIRACASHPWDYPDDSQAARLSRVLLEQLVPHEQAALELPEPLDPRALRVVNMLKANVSDPRTLPELASEAGASPRTIERLFTHEAGMSFGRWRVRHKMLAALEMLAHGESVSKVSFATGYETPSSFITTFKSTFGTTPTAYFQ